MILKLTSTEYYQETLYDYNVDGHKHNLFVITDSLVDAHRFTDQNELSQKIKEIKAEFGEIRYEVIQE